jgi:AcrR family transcriptional regulator
MSKTKPYHHANLRETLLAETAVMIAEDGVNSVTMRGLAQRAGVSRGAPYRHFSDKASLLTAVAEDGFQRLVQQMTATANSTSHLQNFYQIGAAYIHFAVENPTHYRLMFGHEGIKRAETPDLSLAADSAFAVLQNTIELCQQEGTLKSGDPCLLGYTTWAMVHGTASLLIDRQTHDDIDTEAFIQLSYQALANGIVVMG